MKLPGTNPWTLGRYWLGHRQLPSRELRKGDRFRTADGRVHILDKDWQDISLEDLRRMGIVFTNRPRDFFVPLRSN